MRVSKYDTNSKAFRSGQGIAGCTFVNLFAELLGHFCLYKLGELLLHNLLLNRFKEAL